MWGDDEGGFGQIGEQERQADGSNVLEVIPPLARPMQKENERGVLCDIRGMKEIGQRRVDDFSGRHGAV